MSVSRREQPPLILPGFWSVVAMVKESNKHYTGQSLKQQTCMISALSTATKEMENPADTAEKVGISALIVQVNYL